MSSNYRADDIKVLEGLEAVRKRPGMYIGSTGKSGLNHLIFEVVDNSIDEAMAGYCTDIEVIIDEGNIVTVKDNGRGIPIDKHKEKGIPAVEVVMTTLHAGGKFEGKGYKVSGGLHGVGVSVVNALSDWLEVEVRREGKKYIQKYFRGVPKNVVGETQPYDGDDTGTIMRFFPDDSIFDDIIFSTDVIDHRLKELAFLNKGIGIRFIDRRENAVKEFLSLGDAVDDDDSDDEDAPAKEVVSAEDAPKEINNFYKYEGGIKSYVETMTSTKQRLFSPHCKRNA